MSRPHLPTEPRPPLLRTALLLAAFTLALLCSGCLRTRFDLCAEQPPHPDCLAIDGAIDAAGLDAGAPDASAALDASASDDASAGDAGATGDDGG